MQPRTGSFEFWFSERRWVWSDEVYRMHGYEPGAVEPTTELILAHKHPDDRGEVAELIARSVTDSTPFSSRHRFFDTDGTEHCVIVVADSIHNDAGTIVGTAGYYVDLTATLAETAQDALQSTLAGVVESRAVIEQAKGLLMRNYRIDADQAFKILVWRSQETNTKLRDLAAQLVEDAVELPAPDSGTVSGFDHILLTAHERVGKNS
ncbi:PAS and ANTAR domain-containing protein [Nocardia stercoris]|uniref:PAS and ANTAR domain-containing protein n=1 Tax=Nocardia stercoris TaxID=2483361 RepID=UPI001F405684|nr:PAS and ANTAR domain-containing protein [Nocardia stercoris]